MRKIAELRVHSKINYQFWELSRLSAKAWKPSHIKYMPCFQGAGGQDESASKKKSKVIFE
jgi:hypothetical protein